ncbi:DUF554 domain-containing protein [Alicyclobacillus fastidiosus]|uniref:DUF554 domain-containing protein n=1 Tax=Alicyclobacillus fastidiosus TaxID=392011 RepID=A0ABY6ZGV1_9BACL|nr:DUF554 domain-containing protein [Alicyclobacillus fastidiosus]WAH41950.1 DUF554 domain-containing protein [Alicyclobacillus fastidiosus]GMA63675.1 membrane protein [Alicyclobacillus fastidiosus]
MFLLGTIVDALSILVGSLIGLAFPRIPDRMKDTVMKGLSLCVMLIGLSMALGDSSDDLIIIVSVVLGAVVGEWINIDNALLRFGHWMEVHVQKLYKGPIAEGFVSGTLLFCVGSMAIVGSIQDGLSGSHRTLFAKSVLDMFSSIVFSTTLGFGVGLSAIPVFLYQGAIALISHLAGNVLNAPDVIACITATGGLLIIGIGFNMYGFKKIAVANLLPAIAFAPVLKVCSPHVLHAFHALS